MSLIATDKRRIIVGLGTTGLSVARFLRARGLAFEVVDTRAVPPGRDELLREHPGVRLHCGALDDDLLAQADELYVNPGLALAEPALRAAAAVGVRMSGDIDLFTRAAQAPVVAITGSNAKSTVTMLVGLMAEAAGRRVAVGGNLGTPALDLLDEAVDLYVLELSSFQLETTQCVGAEVATCLNISEDHMDRYADLAAYHLAKHRIFRGARQVVVNRDDALSMPLVGEGVRQWSFGLSEPDFQGWGLREHEGESWLAFAREPVLAVRELRLPGRHNQSNALAALALGHAVGLPVPAMLEVLRHFEGLPHRTQWVAERAGVVYINDSKATNVGAALAAIAGLGQKPLVLIAGGDAKGADLSPLREPVLRHCRAVVLMGRDAPRLSAALEGVPQVHADSIEAAVEQAADLAQAGDMVLLSPACASLDMFKNYEERGARFSAAVEALP